MEQDEFDNLLAKAVPDLDADTEIEVTEEPHPEEPEAAEEPEEELEEEVEEEDSPQFSPDIQAFLDKYNGDVSKALEAAVNAQSKLGEQGQELGELRRMVQELGEKIPAKTPQSPFVPAEFQDAIVENPEQWALWAVQNENQAVYDQAMNEWYEQAPARAARFERAMEMQMLEQRLQQQYQPVTETVAQQQNANAITSAHRALSQKYPDFQQVLESATEGELAGIDRNLLAQAQQTNPEAALELVYRWVSAGRETEAARKAQRKEASRQAKKEAAAVVTGEGSSDSKPEPTTMDKLKEAMLSPEPHSVYHSLTSE